MTLSKNKIISTIGFFAFAFILGLLLNSFPVGFIVALGLFCHEMGHVYKIDKYGIERGPVLFIPFMGALINMKSYPENLRQEFLLKIYGPIGGLYFSFVLLGLTLIFPSETLFLALMITCIINLFNLLVVIPPLDGGSMMLALVQSVFGKTGGYFYHITALLAFVFLISFVWFSPVFIIIRLLSLGELNTLRQDYRQNTMKPSELIDSIMEFVLTILAFFLLIYYSGHSLMLLELLAG